MTRTKQVVVEVPTSTNALELHRMLGELLARLPDHLRSSSIVQGRNTGGSDHWGHDLGIEIVYERELTPDEDAAEQAHEKTLIETMAYYRAHGDNQSATAASLGIARQTLQNRLRRAAGLGLLGNLPWTPIEGLTVIGATRLEGDRS